MGALGMTWPTCTTTTGPDLRVSRRARYVYRLAGKKFSQKGNTKGDSLFRTQFPTGAVVYVTEGEGLQAIEAVGGAIATCSRWAPVKLIASTGHRCRAGRDHRPRQGRAGPQARRGHHRDPRRREGFQRACGRSQDRQGRSRPHRSRLAALAEFVKASWWTPNETSSPGCATVNGADADVSAAAVRGATAHRARRTQLRRRPAQDRQSWLVGQIGLGLAGGTTVLGAVKVDTRPVLYPALEDGGRRLRTASARSSARTWLSKRMHYITKATPAADHSDDHRVPGPLPWPAAGHLPRHLRQGEARRSERIKSPIKRITRSRAS